MNPARHTSLLSDHEVGVTRRSHEMLGLVEGASLSGFCHAQHEK